MQSFIFTNTLFLSGTRYLRDNRYSPQPKLIRFSKTYIIYTQLTKTNDYKGDSYHESIRL